MSIYDSVYELISQYVYGGAATTDETLICTLFATFLAIAVVGIPFVILYKVIISILGV